MIKSMSAGPLVDIRDAFGILVTVEFDDNTTVNIPALWTLKDMGKKKRDGSLMVQNLIENLINSINDYMEHKDGR